MCGITLIIPGATDPSKLLPQASLASFGQWYAARSLEGPGAPLEQLEARLEAALHRRGPDAQGRVRIGPATLASSVLALRGDAVTAQPLQHPVPPAPHGTALLSGAVGDWNCAGLERRAVRE